MPALTFERDTGKRTNDRRRHHHHKTFRARHGKVIPVTSVAFVRISPVWSEANGLGRFDAEHTYARM